MIDTNSPTLSKETKHLNGTYTQYFNRQHQRVGHVFQGRFKAILVQKDVYLLELARYIALNPVRAQRVRSAKAWRWSSYRATAGYEKNDACLTTEWILAGFDKTKRVAQQRYQDFVKAGKEPYVSGYLSPQLKPRNLKGEARGEDAKELFERI